MLNIEIKTIPDKDQGHNTVGDYKEKQGKLIITVSDMGNWKHEMLVALHELIESALCKARGIEYTKVEEFDQQFEKQRKYGILDEPGSNINAPYRKEHQFALKMENIFADELGVDWDEHNELITGLDDLTLEK